jgi:hypothetical protein
MRPEFQEWPKIPRLRREIIISEKLDGTNSSVTITDEGEFYTGSRTRWITPEQDNYGFARWAHEHETELRTLGPGTHFGEWWGAGIQRTYGLKEKRFSLFNTGRWISQEPDRFNDRQEVVPACCSVVPILYRGIFDSNAIESVVELLRSKGSVAAPGFARPEGVIVYHVAGGYFFKRLLEKDDEHKGAQ